MRWTVELADEIRLVQQNFHWSMSIYRTLIERKVLLRATRDDRLSTQTISLVGTIAIDEKRYSYRQMPGN